MFFRSFNPIWSFVDLTGLQLDDTYYMFVLQNTIPYLPATIYETPSGTPWINPIQFLANGTLPDNMYWDVGTSTEPNVYRLEIRKGNTQSDPLIYLIENYIPGQEGGGNPPEDISFTTENQISNPQFAFINFITPYTFTSSSGATIEIAPGWFIELGAPSGTGSITFTQVPLNNSAGTVNPTNAPYALQINSSGWSSLQLYQLFNQNGMLWTSNDGTTNNVAISITAQTQGSVGNITAQLVDSNGTNLGIFTNLNNAQIDNEWNVYSGLIAPMPPTTNPDLPPAAYISLQILLDVNIDYYLTSIQLVNSTEALEIPYEESTIERQLDHLFHYYKPLLAFKPIPSYLVGWDFLLNPAQFSNNKNVAASSTGANTSYYAWDQTIVFQSVNNAATITGAAFNCTAANNTQIALIQYIDLPRAYDISLEVFLNGLSANLRGGSTVDQTITISLWYTNNGSLPSMGSNQSLVNTLDANGHPNSVVAGWTEIKNINGQVTFTITPGTIDYGFSGWLLPNAPLVTYMAIVVGTNTIVSGNLINIDSISLVPGSIPTIPAPQTSDEVLRECQYYYETSYSSVLDFTNNPLNNLTELNQTVFIPGASSSGLAAYASPGSVSFKVGKRTNPNMTFYSGAATLNDLSVTLWYNNAGTLTAIGPNDIVQSTFYNVTAKQNSFYLLPKSVTAIVSGGLATSSTTFCTAGIGFHWISDARLGIV